MEESKSKYLMVSSAPDEKVPTFGGSNPLHHADFTCRFHEPIVFPVNAQVRMVNCRLNLKDENIQIDHSNNTLAWSLGQGWNTNLTPGMGLNIAQIRPGSYLNAQGSDSRYITYALKEALDFSVGSFAYLRGGFGVTMDSNKKITIKLSSVEMPELGIGNITTQSGSVGAWSQYQRKGLDGNGAIVDYLKRGSYRMLQNAPSGDNDNLYGILFKNTNTAATNAKKALWCGNPVISGKSNTDHSTTQRRGSMLFEIDCSSLNAGVAGWEMQFGFAPEKVCESDHFYRYKQNLDQNSEESTTPIFAPTGTVNAGVGTLGGQGLINFIVKNVAGTVRLYATTHGVDLDELANGNTDWAVHKTAIATDSTTYNAGFGNLLNGTDISADIAASKNIGIRITFHEPGVEYNESNANTYKYKVGVFIRRTDDSAAAIFDKQLYIWDQSFYTLGGSDKRKSPDFSASAISEVEAELMQGGVAPYVMINGKTYAGNNHPLYVACAWDLPDRRYTTSSNAVGAYQDLTIFGGGISQTQLENLTTTANSSITSSPCIVPADAEGRRRIFMANVENDVGFDADDIGQITSGSLYSTGIITNATDPTRSDMASYFLEMPDLPVKNFTGGLLTGQPNNYVGIISLHQKAFDDLYLGENRTQIWMNLHNTYPIQMNALRFRVCDIYNNTVKGVMASTIINLAIRQHPDYARNKALERIFEKLIDERAKSQEGQVQMSAPQIEISKKTGQ